MTPDPAVARALAIPGVVGAGWGAPRRGGRWYRSRRVLVLRVERKLLPDQVPSAQDLCGLGLEVDVVEVGRPDLAALVHAGAWAGREPSDMAAATLTAIARGAAGRGLGLASGHGSLPLARSGLRRAWPPNPPQTDPKVWVGTADGPVEGRCLAAALDTDQDWALLDLDAHFEVYQPAARAAVVPPWRTVTVGPGTRVRTWSRTQDRQTLGEVTAELALTVVIPTDGSTIRYDRLIEVRSISATRFAKPGDSGTLVFVDADPPRVVGTVVATQGSIGLAWVLPMDGFLRATPEARRFFRS